MSSVEEQPKPTPRNSPNAPNRDPNNVPDPETEKEPLYAALESLA